MEYDDDGGYDGDGDDDVDQVDHPTARLVLLGHVVDCTEGEEQSAETWWRSQRIIGSVVI